MYLWHTKTTIFFKCGRKKGSGNYILIPNTQNSLSLTISLSTSIFSLSFTQEGKANTYYQNNYKERQKSHSHNVGWRGTLVREHSTRPKPNPNPKSKIPDKGEVEKPFSQILGRRVSKSFPDEPGNQFPFRSILSFHLTEYSKLLWDNTDYLQ